MPSTKSIFRYAKEESGPISRKLREDCTALATVPFFSADLQESQILDIAD